MIDHSEKASGATGGSKQRSGAVLWFMRRNAPMPGDASGAEAQDARRKSLALVEELADFDDGGEEDGTQRRKSLSRKTAPGALGLPPVGGSKKKDLMQPMSAREISGLSADG